MDFSDLLARFDASPDGDEFIAICPSHDDHRPTLAIRRGDDGRALFCCRAGCETRDILAARGLRLSDLFPPANGHTNGRANGSRQIVATYDYRDAGGELVYQVVRFEPKDFRQRRPDGSGGWTWSLKGVRRVLYRLPQLAGADPREPVYLVEGEKDADALASLGLVATCNAGGAGKWTDAYTDALQGRHVVLLPDNDDPGRKHARDVSARLAGRAASVRIVRLPGLTEKGDVSDWLQAGGTADELRRLTDATAPETWEDSGPPARTAEPQRTPCQSAAITNATVTIGDNGERIIDPLPMADILRSVRTATGGWPRRIGDALFVDEAGKLSWLPTTDALFGWLGHATGSPAEFVRSTKCHTQAQVFHELRRTSEAYQSVEALPHEPPMPGHYYACDPPEPGTGRALADLVGRYCPETDIDADLIKAMFATIIWGGESGCRPAFLITSDAGRGAGKTTLASHVAHLAGGAIELSANEDAGVIKQRLLSPEGMTRRVALLDNVKTLRFSWAELESLITAPTISGKRLYVGEGQRPNNLLWLITLNGASLAKDLAQRCVIIKLGKPSRSGTWAEDTRRFIDNHRTGIIADCISLLRSERFPLERFTRWASWERDVLQRLPEPSEAQAAIRERQAVADVEDEEAGMVQDHFAQRLQRLGYDTDSGSIFLPSRIVGDWYCEATRERVSATAVSRRLNQAISEGTVTLIQRNKCNTHGRGFSWRGPHCNPTEPMSTDLESRITHHLQG